jgi:C4-dicarboxylate-binding protein DctP
MCVEAHPQDAVDCTSLGRAKDNQKETVMASYTRREALATVGAIAAAAALPLAVQAQAPIIIKFSHVVAPNTPKGRAAERFKELAEKRLSGKVKIELYPNSQLYKDGEEMEALSLGSVQMLAPSLAKFGPLGVREFEVFDLPFIFDDYAALHKVTEGESGKALLKKLEAKGISGLAYWDNGFKVLSANTPLKLPPDAKGKKMRIQSSKVLEAQMRAISAIPQTMAFSEVYQALQTGVVDGTENPPSNMYTQKMHEVQKHAIVTNHGYLGYAVIVNKKFWDGLPADVRKELEAAMAEATRYANAIAAQDNQQALDAIKASGKTAVYVPTPQERSAWKKAMLPVHKDMESRIGKDTIQAVYKAVGFKPE